MDNFTAIVERLTIEDHPSDNDLETAITGGHRVTVGKGDFTTGDLAVYVPNRPNHAWLIKQLDHVAHPVQLAQGIIIPCPSSITLSWAVYEADPNKGLLALINEDAGEYEEFFQEVSEGDDVTAALGIS